MMQGVSSVQANVAQTNAGQVYFGDTGRHEKICILEDGRMQVPDHVRVPVIPGDGIGEEITREAQRVVDKAVRASYGDTKSIEWVPLEAGEKALAHTGSLLPDETVATVAEHHILAKGPLGTPTGGGFRSINVQLRQIFDLFANIRPVRKLPGVASPLKNDKIDVVIFRENTEDVYAGIEAEKDSAFARDIRETAAKHGHIISEDSGVGLKPMSEAASKRIMRAAMDYAIKNNRKMVTIVHKGNIQKYTEGAFLNWCNEVAQSEYAGRVISMEEFYEKYNGNLDKLPVGKIVVRDRIADAQHQDAIMYPDKHDVIVTTNLNGDYLSDAYAATVGGLGLAPGGNMGNGMAIFEAVHGTAPDIAGQNKANPTAMFLSMILMLNHLGWGRAADKMNAAIEKTLQQGKVTADLASRRKIDQTLGALLDKVKLRQPVQRLLDGLTHILKKLPLLKTLATRLPNLRTPLSTTAYTNAVIDNIA